MKGKSTAKIQGKFRCSGLDIDGKYRTIEYKFDDKFKFIDESLVDSERSRFSDFITNIFSIQSDKNYSYMTALKQPVWDVTVVNVEVTYDDGSPKDNFIFNIDGFKTACDFLNYVTHEMPSKPFYSYTYGNDGMINAKHEKQVISTASQLKADTGKLVIKGSIGISYRENHQQQVLRYKFDETMNIKNSNIDSKSSDDFVEVLEKIKDILTKGSAFKKLNKPYKYITGDLSASFICPESRGEFGGKICDIDKLFDFYCYLVRSCPADIWSVSTYYIRVPPYDLSNPVSEIEKKQDAPLSSREPLLTAFNKTKALTCNDDDQLNSISYKLCCNIC